MIKLQVWVEESIGWGDTCTTFVDVEVKSYKWGQNAEVERLIQNREYNNFHQDWRIGRILYEDGSDAFVEYDKPEWEPEDTGDI